MVIFTRAHHFGGTFVVATVCPPFPCWSLKTHTIFCAIDWVSVIVPGFSVVLQLFSSVVIRPYCRMWEEIIFYIGLCDWQQEKFQKLKLANFEFSGNSLPILVGFQGGNSAAYFRAVFNAVKRWHEPCSKDNQVSLVTTGTGIPLVYGYHYIFWPLDLFSQWFI